MADDNSKIEVVGGDPPPPPPVEPSKCWILQVGFDPTNQGLAIEWDDKQIKSWDMACMILHGALLQAQFFRNMGHSAMLQAGAQKQIQEQMMKAQLEAERLAGRAGRRIH